MALQPLPSQFVVSQRSKIILILGIILCWPAVGNASKDWDAKASARINLRRRPSLSGEILNIIPNGHNVRILNKSGRWCKVEVGGEINGKGWVYAQYLKGIAPKATKMQASAQAATVVTVTKKQNKQLQPGGQQPKSRPDVKEVKSTDLALSEKFPTTSIKQQSLARSTLTHTKNESIALSPLEISMNVQPIPLLPNQGIYFGFKEEMQLTTGKGVSKPVEKRDLTTFQKPTSDQKKKHSEVVQKIVPESIEQPVSDIGSDAKAASVIKSSVSYEIERQAFERQSIGPVAITLKLVSIVLYCLVVLLLYKKS